MYDTCECPYCGHDNDMTDGTVDLPSDNKFDHECEKCKQEFEVFVEFNPTYSAEKIEYVKCEKCGEETRDIYEQGRIYPWPKFIDKKRICYSCFRKAHVEEYKALNQK